MPQRRLLGAAPVLLAVLGWRSRWVTEDAFIDFRVIQHALSGHGPVFNIGERVEAYTNALWIAILAIISTLFAPVHGTHIPLEWIAVLLGLSGAVGGVIFAQLGALRLARAEGRVGVAWPLGALAMVVVPPAWSFATSGLETGLAQLWLGLCFWGSIRFPRAGRRWLPPVVGLGPLIRPDLAIYSAGFLLLLFIATRRPRSFVRWAKILAAAALLPMGYQIFRMGYFAELVPNTAIAKEASRARWDQGVYYLVDFAGTYWLVIPLLGTLLATAFGIRNVVASGGGRRLRRLALTVVPIVCALLQAAYVTRVGGDFMHGRMLLPAWFAALMPAAMVAGSRRRPPVLPALIIVPWALACGFFLRVPYIGGTHSGHGPHGITEERYHYTDVAHRPDPVTIADYANHPWTRGGLALHDTAEKTRALYPWRPAAEDVPEHTHEMKLSRRVPSQVVSVYGNVGLFGYAAGERVHVVDRRGLGDALAAHLELEDRGRPGHEKDLPDEWVVARFAEIVDESEQQGGPALEPKVRDARDALHCGDLAELVRAITEPLTARRFLRNIALSWRLGQFRFPRDPTLAKERLCGPQPDHSAP